MCEGRPLAGFGGVTGRLRWFSGVRAGLAGVQQVAGWAALASLRRL